MALVCESCGEWVRSEVQADRRSVRCPACGHIEAMNILPLFIVTGPSGAGKTTVVPELRHLLPDWEVFETDILASDDWQKVIDGWLRIAHSIAQSGRHTLLCGTWLPEKVDQCSHRPYFSNVHYLCLYGNDQALATRLRSRPPWRGWTEEKIAEHQRFTRWLLANAATAFDPPLRLVDTSHLSPREAAEEIRDWALTTIGRISRQEE